MSATDNHLARQLILATLHRSPALPAADFLARMRHGDWEHFLNLAAMHRLSALLHDSLGRKGLAAALPVPIRQRLEKARRRQALRHLALYGELARVIGLLDAAAIPALALKGAFLAQFTYPAAGLRPMRDLDLLVPRHQAVVAFEHLKAAGYRPIYHGLAEAHLDGGKIHLPPLASPAGIVVELHHRLTAPDPDRPLAEDFERDLWQRAVARPLGTGTVRFPGPADLLLHLCHHAMIGHQLSIGPLVLTDILWLADNADIDWDDFLRLADRGQWRRCALAPLYLAKAHLDAAIPDRVIAALRGDGDGTAWLASADYLLFAPADDHALLNAHMQRLLCSKRLSDRIASLFRLAFPSREIIATHFPVRAESPKALLYYPLNWHRLFKKKIPGLMALLLKRPAAMETLAAHKLSINSWLRAPADSRRDGGPPP